MALESRLMKHIDLLIERYPSLEPIKQDLIDAYLIIEESYEKGGKLLVAGNGGSAADSEHIVGELMKGFKMPRKVTSEFAGNLKAVDEELGTVLAENLQGALPAIPLSGNGPLTTAVINDTHADLIYAQQVIGLGKEGDVLLCISTSGNARDCCLAAIVAGQMKVKVISLTGETGGKLAELSDCLLNVPELKTDKVQELHLPLYHALCAQLEEVFFGGRS